MGTPVKETSFRRMKRREDCVGIRRYGVRTFWSAAAISLAAAGTLGFAAPASAQQVRLTKLSNASFGTISSFTADSQKNENVCAYSSTSGGGYGITATGSGSGGAFTLSGSSATLAYEVQWSSSSGQTSGTSLSPGIALTGQTSGAQSSNCNIGPATTASLIILIRASAASIATAASYSGTLTLMIAPE